MTPTLSRVYSFKPLIWPEARGVYFYTCKNEKAKPHLLRQLDRFRLGNTDEIDTSAWPKVKIGQAINIEKRLRSHYSSLPDPPLLIAVDLCNNQQEKEKEYHLRFSGLRVHGEWFFIDDHIQRLIFDLREKLPSGLFFPDTRTQEDDSILQRELWLLQHPDATLQRTKYRFQAMARRAKTQERRQKQPAEEFFFQKDYINRFSVK